MTRTLKRARYTDTCSAGALAPAAENHQKYPRLAS
jgi:hypothetical protein